MIEIERKFLLKKLPVAAKSGPGSINSVIFIRQFYLDSWRYRSERINGVTSYIKLQKVTYGKGMAHELHIQDITFEEFHEAFKKSTKHISKIRYLYNTSASSQILTVDDFTDMKIIMLEVEIPHIDFELQIPDNIQEEIIYEVTGLKEFSNKNLA